MDKALWVVRDKITTQSAIDDLMADAATRGIHDVVVQVRGRGDAYYHSTLEPRAESLTGEFRPSGASRSCRRCGGRARTRVGQRLLRVVEPGGRAPDVAGASRATASGVAPEVGRREISRPRRWQRLGRDLHRSEERGGARAHA